MPSTDTQHHIDAEACAYKRAGPTPLMYDVQQQVFRLPKTTWDYLVGTDEVDIYWLDFTLTRTFRADAGFAAEHVQMSGDYVLFPARCFKQYGEQAQLPNVRGPELRVFLATPKGWGEDLQGCAVRRLGSYLQDTHAPAGKLIRVVTGYEDWQHRNGHISKPGKHVWNQWPIDVAAGTVSGREPFVGKEAMRGDPTYHVFVVPVEPNDHGRLDSHVGMAAAQIVTHALKLGKPVFVWRAPESPDDDLPDSELDKLSTVKEVRRDHDENLYTRGHELVLVGT